jgi:imidazoleglycerol-phosphate dehydratase
VQRTTRETSVEVAIDVDGSGTSDISTGIGFLDHMLESLARHGRLDLTVRATGDLHIDAHHTVEDVGIVLGQALNQALGTRAGIRRFADATVPLDEALAHVALDLSGRPYAVLDLPFGGPMLGTLPTELVAHFLQSLAHEARMTLHARVLAGDNDHHRAEAVFKALARALESATRLDPRLGGGIPSTKGTL